MRVDKQIDHNFKTTVCNTGQYLHQNRCFQNCLTAIQIDNTKMFSLGFSAISGTNQTALHGWLEDDNLIYELTQPLQNDIEYYKVFSLSYAQLQRYFPIQSLDCLIDHRHFMLSYCRMHNFMIEKGYYLTLTGRLVKCKLPLTKRFTAILGHIERKLLLW
ncbi:hypothetical protein D3C87_12560 [compost metagenome]